MNAKKFAIVIALAATTAGSAFAGDRNFPNTDSGVVSSKTRAEVIAELQDARAKGLTYIGDHDQLMPAAVASDKTRADVRAELVAAIRNNEIQKITN